MSWTAYSDQNGKPLVHYGVKGMKWGVRRTAEQLGHKVKKAGKKTWDVLTKPMFQIPHPKFKNPKVQKLVDKGIDILQPYASPGGLVTLAVFAVLPGIGVGSVAAGQAAVEGLKATKQLNKSIELASDVVDIVSDDDVRHCAWTVKKVN